MTFHADLHVHSRYSRATSREAALEPYSAWARRKGIAVVGTGDFTHPAWRAELREKLVPSEPGLFRLREDLERAVERHVPDACRAPDGGGQAGPTRFLLEVEISTIYKRGDRTRKVHHIVCVPDLESADRLAERLARIGNVTSDGRPILGLDSRNLLEIALECGEGCYLIPAHIWTPWFSALGSKSGFDAIDDCYADLASHIFALETGLSSDPAMNWRLAQLDRFRLVSNSDAHSPSKLGRAASVFEGPLDYFAMRRALATGEGYGGTVEFFPEEGKYHLDGHRKCNTRLTPAETRQNHGRCPVCGKPVTVGVMNRVEELADRPEGIRPAGAAPFRSFVPLPEVLGELLQTGPESKRVVAAYDALIARLGPELWLLEHAPFDSLARLGSERLAEAIRRMRAGRVIREAGYDGEYGVIRVFAPEELARDRGSGLLFALPEAADPVTPAAVDRGAKGEMESDGAPGEEAPRPAAEVRECPPAYAAPGAGTLAALDDEQRAAAQVLEGPLFIVAGPGTGKTRTLTHRIAHLVLDHHVPPEQCLAVTFSNRAARELRERLALLVPDEAARIPVMTFHALGYAILAEHAAEAGLPRQIRIADDREATALLVELTGLSETRACRLRDRIARQARDRSAAAPGESGAESPAPDSESAVDVAAAAAQHKYALHARGLVDFDDLIELPAALLESRADLVEEYRQRYRWLSVDEFQDIDGGQYRLVRLLAPPDGNICVIGDPDQSIYGFRGGDCRYVQLFAADYPGARSVHLTRNYRSGRSIVNAALQVITPASLVPGRMLEAQARDATRIVIHESATDRAEAEFVVHTIEQLIGGATFFSMDSGRVDHGDGDALSFADCAVLYRTDAQADALVEALARSGMPYQRRTHGRLAEAAPVQALVAGMRAAADAPDLASGLDAALSAMRDPAATAEARRYADVLKPIAARCAGLDAFLSELALASDSDLWDPRADRISLLTLHASKGLEFPVVFIVGCEDGLLPLAWGGAGEGSADEERRLLFVGMTRASRRLFLCHARKRLWRGALRDMQPSPFLREIEEQLLQRLQTLARPKSRPSGEQLTLF